MTSGRWARRNAYNLDKFGHPETPAELLSHRCIRHRQISANQIAPWEFEIDGERRTVAVTGPLIFNDLRSVADAAQQGFGIGWSLKEGVTEDLEQENLMQVLADFTPKRPPFYIYFSKQLQELPRLRAFVDHFSSA